jgi:F-box protein 18 (helicase)
VNLTEEQRAIVRSKGRRVRVQARAGTGKTSTLCAYAAARPQQRILYVAFNKAIQLEAHSRMPPNVTCRTTHSLAYRKAKQMFGAGDRQKIGNTYPSAVARALRCSPLAATGALQTVQRWCGSLEQQIGAEHVPVEIAARLAEPTQLVEAARSLWRRMLDPGDPDIRLPHLWIDINYE